MKYVALLRGINVGGNNKVDMKTLKVSFESLGLKDVVTYINTGNIIFTDSNRVPDELVRQLEAMMQRDFGLEIKVLLRTQAQIDGVMTALPQEWTNDKDMKSDVMFLWDEVDGPGVKGLLTIKDDIDTVIYASGAILWSVDKVNQSESGMTKLVGTKLYKQMTVRNVNTFRKIHELMGVS